MTFKRNLFFKTVRSSLFDGRLSRDQVEGISTVLDCFESRTDVPDSRWRAYILATAHHETGATMQPVRETFAKSDDRAIAILDSAYGRGRLPSVSVPYWRRDAEGKSWLGRGLVQLTHRANYARMTELTGIDLLADPDRAMETGVAAEIVVVGMIRGSFTGKRLSDYFTVARTDWTGARRIINGRDRAAIVAGYAKAYHAAITLSAPDGQPGGLLA
ncbi:hypothetical protein [Pararhizobium antarcticum]|uniref:Glycoside hydrolase family 19 catalytic domain-containing protein n=1 Tax=Pararhizobium antarcticum TaxID=1798805 RepID=A0A657LSV9_9HYPH|nr:hypothetical protein [Pararhizobium antarcticum]OJF95890.1 hypothetical protein AX760_18860 [Pararhizobium antarcticum]OJF99332.1 hypothetical protein AX761_11495 [Rhizobium sp. 58]